MLASVAKKPAQLALNAETIRTDFPILHRMVKGQPLVYLDNAASSQKPQVVIDALDRYYTNAHSNIHRGVHHLSSEGTQAYENSRIAVQQLINAAHSHEVIFTKGTTESINLVAHCFCEKYLEKGDEVLISQMEHHSNIVPWQMACSRNEANLKVVPINDQGELLMEEFKSLLSEKTKLVAITHVSNTLGSINPVNEIIALAHEYGAAVLIDGAQSVPHQQVNVQELNADFYAFSAHKMYGPTGVGVLYGKEKWLNDMPPYQGGGDMIKTVSFEKTTYNDLPHKFEAGTPNIADVIAFKSAIDYLNQIGFDTIFQYESELLDYATAQLLQIDGLRIIGTAQHKSSVISFLVGDTHPYDVGTLLDQMGIAVRTGHHCTEPLMKYFRIPGTIRASFSFYNTHEEVDKLVEGINRAKQMLES